MGQTLKLRLEGSPRAQLGFFLLLWGGLNTSADILLYGLQSGAYWWFCNLSLLGMGYGFFRDDLDFVAGFLAIALFTQSFWLFDDVFFIFFKRSALGLTINYYQNDYLTSEFLLTRYHYFTLPLGIWGIASMKFKKRNTMLKKILIINPIIFFISYSMFSESANINCIYRPCFDIGMSIAPPFYSIFFFLFVLGCHLLCAYCIEKQFGQQLEIQSQKKRKIERFAVFGIVCGIVFSFLSIFRKFEGFFDLS